MSEAKSVDEKSGNEMKKEDEWKPRAIIMNRIKFYEGLLNRGSESQIELAVEKLIWLKAELKHIDATKELEKSNG